MWNTLKSSSERIGHLIRNSPRIPVMIEKKIEGEPRRERARNREMEKPRKSLIIKLVLGRNK